MVMTLLVLASGLLLSSPTPASAQGDTFTVTPDTSLTNLFASYGNTKSGWVGGDGTRSVPLPDGRTAWFFNDTQIRTIKPNGRASAITLVHNSAVIQSAQGALVQTLFTKGTNRRQAYVNLSPYQASRWIWPASTLVSNGTLYVMYSEERGRRTFHQKWAGSYVATFALPSLQMTGIYPITSKTINWTQDLLAGADGFTYIYGMGGTHTYVARTPSSAPLNDQSQWTYFDGSGWSSQQTSATSVSNSLDSEFSITAVGSQYVLITKVPDDLYEGDIDAYVASSPTGPFVNGEPIYQTPGQSGRFKIYAYNAHAQPGLTTTSGNQTTLVVSYDIDSLGIVGQPTAYRPRFLYVTVNAG
jgi:hypothetical protein